MSEDDREGRRRFLAKGARVAAGVGMAASYGTFAAFAVRFLYPAKDQATLWVFVADVAGFARGVSVPFTAPGGAKVAIARPGDAGTADDFIALSSTCPHLGCQVHWQAAEQQFFCPCHNGAFDASGKATAGPPAKAGQSLLRYPLKIEDGLLYVQVPAPDPSDEPSTRRRGRKAPA